MSTLDRQQLAGLLEHAADLLDIPEDLYLDAKSRYEDLASWIKRDNDGRDSTDSEVYAQGSTRLGTIIRPLGKDDEYDIDLVYSRHIQKTSTTQAALKGFTGAQLKRYVAEKQESDEGSPELEEKRRCWTLKYDGRFHMDVLPAIPDDEAQLFSLRDLAESLLITDTDLSRWHHSNPKGYANWFHERMARVFTEQRQFMAKAAQVEVEKIPEWRVKTPLQRAIQVLKRHRDLRYEGDPDNIPASIIISTLAAHAYGQQTNLHDALLAIARGMRGHVVVSNQYSIPNPINPKENFADRWNERPERAEAFFAWAQQVDRDLTIALNQGGLEKAASVLMPCLGRKLIAAALSRQSGGATTTPFIEGAPELGDSSHCQSLPFPMRLSPRYRATITATIHAQKHSPTVLWPFRGRPLPKSVCEKPL